MVLYSIHCRVGHLRGDSVQEAGLVPASCIQLHICNRFPEAAEVQVHVSVLITEDFTQDLVKVSRSLAVLAEFHSITPIVYLSITLLNSYTNI